MQRFTPEPIGADRRSRCTVGGRCFVDETYVTSTVSGGTCTGGIGQHGQAIDVFVARRRGISVASRFFTSSLAAHRSPVEVITDRAAALASVIEELTPAAFRNTASTRTIGASAITAG